MPTRIQPFVVAACLGLFTVAAEALPIVPVSYSVNTDSTTAHFHFTFDRPYSPALGDEFQVYTVDGPTAYEDIQLRMRGTGIAHTNSMESTYAIERLYSPLAPPVSMVRWVLPDASNNQVPVVSIVPFRPGTQDNGFGNWGSIQGYVTDTRTGNSVDASVPLAMLQMSSNFTYFFETYQHGAGTSDRFGSPLQWLGYTNINFAEPLAVPGIVPIPEPSTVALMLAGLGVVLVTARLEKSSRGALRAGGPVLPT